MVLFISFSYSCGYRKVFEDYSGIIQQKYPEISVVGANYDPPGLNMYLSRMIVSISCLATLSRLSMDVFLLLFCYMAVYILENIPYLNPGKIYKSK